MDSAKNIFEPIRSGTRQYSKSDLFLDILNCNFVADNLGAMLSILFDSGSMGISIGACIAALGLLNWFILFFGMTYVFRTVSYRQSSNAKDNNQVSDEKNNLKENQPEIK